MGRVEETPSSDPVPDQTAFQSPSEGYPVPLSNAQIPPPQGYPNHHHNPLSSPPPHMYVASQPTKQQPHEIHLPPEQPTTYQVPQCSPVGNPNPQMYMTYTPNHNYAGYQPPVATGTPNLYQPQPPVTMNVQEWTTGLLECFDDPENAIMTFCFPCVTFGQIAEIADNGQTSCATSGLIYSLIVSFIGIPCIMSCTYRTKVRSRYNLVETPAPDWVIHLFCEYCALCQEYRELKNRGMDPALGWQGNLSKQQQMANCATMTPPINQRMMS